jgi:predicted alpha/beta-fold hydrolase
MKLPQVDPTFQPSWWLRSPHLQSVLPSLALRRAAVRRRAAPLLAASERVLVDCGEGTVLQAQVSRPPAGTPVRGSVVMLHGWEGTADALYLLCAAQALFERGHEIVRLTLRDHGDTHHLNREIFHSCRLAEVVGAVTTIARGAPGRDLSLVGFSLGGNFALRVALEAPRAGLALRRVVAVSPVLDPATTLDALEQGLPIYERYFIRKWSRSLRRKQAVWPGAFDFGPLLHGHGIRHMTAQLVREHTPYPDLESYLAGYALTGQRLAQLEVPATLITASDDPIIPVADLARLEQVGALRVVLTRHGGHCGFLESLGTPRWLERRIVAELEGERIVHSPVAASPATQS